MLIFQSTPNDFKLKSNDLTRKVTLISSPKTFRVPNFHPFRSIIKRFQDIAHFIDFPLTPMLKFQSATIFF